MGVLRGESRRAPSPSGRAVGAAAPRTRTRVGPSLAKPGGPRAGAAGAGTSRTYRPAGHRAKSP